MLTGSPIKSIILFALPIMFSSLLQYNYTLVDNIIVGRYISTDALAAAGSVGPINSLLSAQPSGLQAVFQFPSPTLSVQATKNDSLIMRQTVSALHF